MSNKSYLSYKNIFQDLKLLIEQNNIIWDYKDIKFTSDFERSLLYSIKEEFSSSKIQNCFFHFVKALWQKCKKLGLTKSKYIKTTKILVFASKLYPLILEDNKSTYINNLYEYANSLGGEYKKFVKYF